MGIFDSLTGNNGLFGLGGSQGMMNPSIGLLGNNIDQGALRNYTLKNMLLGAGAGLLSQQPSTMPITFGSSLGAGLTQGLAQGQQAQQDYIKNAMLGQQLKMQNQQMQIAQQGADQSKALFPGQLTGQMTANQGAALDLSSKQAQQNALKGAPSAAYLNPSAYGASQLPHIEDVAYDYMGHPIREWTKYDPSKLDQPLNAGVMGAMGQMDIGSIPPTSLTARGYADPVSQKQTYEAMGGDRNPLAAAALQVATNQRQFSPREAGNFVLQQMVQKLNPGWGNSDYNTIQSVNKGFANGPQAAQLTSAFRGTGHLDDAWRKTYVLPDIGIAAANSTWNQIRSLGNAPDLAAVDPALQLAGNESVKLATGGTGALADRQSAHDNFHASGTAQDREAAFKTVVDQGNQAVMGLFDQYRNAHNGSLKGFDPNVIAKRIAITRELGNDTAPLDEAFKETTGQPYEAAIPALMQNGTLNKLDTVDWSSIENPKFRDLKKQAYAQINSGNPDAGFATLVKGGAKLIGDTPASNGAGGQAGGPINIDGYSIKQVK